MAKALSCYKGYAGIYESVKGFYGGRDKDYYIEGGFELRFYRYGYPYNEIMKFCTTEKECNLQRLFNEVVEKQWARNEEIYPYITHLCPLKDDDTIITPNSLKEKFNVG